MNRNELIKDFTNAVEHMRKSNGYGTYYWWLDEDDKGNSWAIVLGWTDGFDKDPNDNNLDGTWRICVKLAFQPWNSIMQCDYDVDWQMPYDEVTGEVDDTEIAIYSDTNLTETINWLLNYYSNYNK